MRSVAFYNLENLFDTENDTLTFDDARTSLGRDRWSKERYLRKIDKLGQVLASIVLAESGSLPDLIGVCEVENRGVLEDLVQQKLLKTTSYGIIHRDSPDERGIDVALIYKRSVFFPRVINSHRLLLYDEEGQRNYTRDLLVVNGVLDDMEINLLINHWPSRSGGKLRSEPNRLLAAGLNRHVVDSIMKIQPNSGIIVMGDYNDNPTDKSLKKILGTVGDTALLTSPALYNPMEGLFKKGAGSLAYRDTWSLFDQILLSAQLLQPQRGRYRFWKAGIYAPGYLITQNGRYKGYPWRTYSGGRYTGGYSDHLPVYVLLIRKIP